MSKLVNIADAVVTLINTPIVELPYAQAFTATRAFAPFSRPEDMGSTVYVRVIPLSEESVRESRDRWQFTGEIGVVVQRNIGKANETLIPGLSTLAEQIQDRLRTMLPVVATIDAKLAVLEVNREPYVAEPHLREHGVFTTQIVVSYRYWRSG